MPWGERATQYSRVVFDARRRIAHVASLELPVWIVSESVVVSSGAMFHTRPAGPALQGSSTSPGRACRHRAALVICRSAASGCRCFSLPAPGAIGSGRRGAREAESRRWSVEFIRKGLIELELSNGLRLGGIEAQVQDGDRVAQVAHHWKGRGR